MKLISVLFSVLFSFTASAHCPIPISAGGSNYCTDVEWQNGDRLVKGALETSDFLSPYLNKMAEVPQKWIYSRAIFRVWQDGDKSHLPVTIEGLRIFPFMVMENGMHHIASYSFEYSAADSAYIMSGFSMQEMPGCWSLRWTVQGDDAVESSVQAANVESFSNLSEDENSMVKKYCVNSGAAAPMPSGHHHP